jgi:hypothetical protein
MFASVIRFTAMIIVAQTRASVTGCHWAGSEGWGGAFGA